MSWQKTPSQYEEQYAALETLYRQALDDKNDLIRWKVEAMEVLGAWEEVWEAAGKPGPLAGSKALSVAESIIASRAEIEELKQWMSDACEVLHDMRGMCEAESYDEGAEAILALLRRAENP